MIARLPEDQHWWFASRTRAIESLLDPAIGGRGGLQVLDVGSGAGNMAHHLERYGRVTGFDSFSSPLQVAVSRGCRVLQADAEHLPFVTELFDMVAALDVIEHCDDDFRVLGEIHRVTKAGGLLVLTVPAFSWLWSYNDVVNHHRRRYSAEALRARVEEAGFEVKRIGYNNFFVFPMAAAAIALRASKKKPISAPSVDGAYQVEMEPAPPVINAVLDLVGRLEASFIKRFDFPVGTGILCLAERLG